MSSRISKPKSKEAPKVGPPLTSPTKNLGPVRRPPSNRQRPTDESFGFSDCLIILAILFFLIISTIGFTGLASVYMTGTWAFGHDLDDLPAALNALKTDFINAVVPPEFLPKIGKLGNAKLSKTTTLGGSKYGRLPIFTEAELKEHDGTDIHLPIWLSITGLVFDVTSGKDYYQKDGGYHFLAGKDATVSFVTGCFDEECFKIQATGWEAIEPLDHKSVIDWVDSYHEKYILIGKLQGAYEMYQLNSPANRYQKFFTPL